MGRPISIFSLLFLTEMEIDLVLGVLEAGGSYWASRYIAHTEKSSRSDRYTSGFSST